FRSLTTARADADKMARFLIKDAGFNTVYVLTEDKATKQRIDQLMIDYIPKVLGRSDRFVFYWSGHGFSRTIGTRNSGFLPLSTSEPNEFASMVSMDDIARWDNYLPSEHALFILDACLSGLAGFQNKGPPVNAQGFFI